MDAFLFVAVSFLLTLILGLCLEKIRIPWIFAALLVGAFYSFIGSQNNEISFLATLGMYFLLFIIGFEMNLKEIMRQSKFICKLTFFIIPFEAVFGTLLLHFVFGVEWFIAAITALSFATVGEAMLVPILDEFKLTKKKFGQIIIGVGTLDDAVEVFTIILLSIALGLSSKEISMTVFSLVLLLSIFGTLFLLTRKSKNKAIFLRVPLLGASFLFVIFLLFLFVGVGKYAEAGALGAILAGIAARNFIPRKRIAAIEKQIKGVAYGFFAPLFFLKVGMDLDVGLIFQNLPLVLLVTAVAKSAKILASIVAGGKELGLKRAVVLGIALSVRFSTSIVVISILYSAGLISQLLYSVLIASTMLFKFIIPSLLSFLIARWKIYK